MTTFIQFRETPEPGMLFGPDAFADAQDRQFMLYVDGQAAALATVFEVAVTDDGAAAVITFRPHGEVPRGELGAAQVA